MRQAAVIIERRAVNAQGDDVAHEGVQVALALNAPPGAAPVAGSAESRNAGKQGQGAGEFQQTARQRLARVGFVMLIGEGHDVSRFHFHGAIITGFSPLGRAFLPPNNPSVLRHNAARIRVMPSSIRML